MAKIDTKLDANQVIKQAYDEANQRIRVDAKVSASISDLFIEDPEGHILNVNPDGSINAVVAITAADGDNIAIKSSTGNELVISPAGAINLPTGASTEVTLSALNAKVVTTANGIKVDSSATTQPVSGTVALDAPTLSALESITVQNGTGVAAVNIQDGGNSITVDGTVSVNNFPATQPVSGTVSVSNFPATQPISAVALPLPSGAATAALQTQPGVDIGDVTINNASGVGAVNIQDGGNSITVDGAVSVNNFPATQAISAATLPLPTGAATDASVSTVNTSITKLGAPNFTSTAFTAAGQSLALNIVGQSTVVLDLSGTFVATIAIFGSVDNGVTTNIPLSGTLLASPDILTSSITEPATVRYNVAGFTHFRVNCASFTSGTVNVKIASSIGTSIIDGSMGTLFTKATIRDADGVSFTGTTQGLKQALDTNLINATLPLPTGASTSALQTSGNTSLSSIDTKTPALGQALAAASTPVVLTAAQIATLTPLTSVGVNNFPASQAVTGTFFQATQPISATTLPLPTSAATSTKQSDGTQKTQIVDPAGASIASLDNGNAGKALQVAYSATNFVFSTVNSTTTQLAAAATFNGTVETVINQQSASILLTSDQNGTLSLLEYIDAGGTRVSRSTTYSILANVPFSRSFVLNGNYFRVNFTNNGAATTTTLNLNTAYGTIPSASALGNGQISLDEVNGTAISLGQKTSALSFPVVLASNQPTINVVSAEASVLFKGRASTFNTPGRAGTTGQNLLSIFNAAGSTVTLKVTKIGLDNSQTVVKAVTVAPPIVRVWKITALPTNGTTLTKNKIGGTTTSNASVSTIGDASADNTGSATTLTATRPAGAIITQEYAPRLITAAGYEMADRLEFLGDTSVTLIAGEGLLIFIDYTLATQNPTTDRWIATIEWSET